MDKVAVSLVVLALSCCILLDLSRAEPLPVARFWVNGVNGADNSTCGVTTTSPCKTLQHVVTQVYEDGNVSFVEIILQSDLLHEDFAIHAFLSPIIIHIYGSQYTLKASSISIPKVEYFHTWIDSSTLSGHLVTFVGCIVTQSFVYEIEEQQQAQQPQLSVDTCQFTDSNITFHTLNITDTLFSNSPLTTPPDGTCDITRSNFTGTIDATALTCGSSTITACVFSDNQGIFGGALNVIQYTLIENSVIANNSALYGGGIYSQGIVTLDNVEISGNNASQDGGGLYFYGSQSDIECLDSVIIKYNDARRGGGILIESDQFSSNMMEAQENCVLYGNSASFEGGAIYVNSSSAAISEFTVVENVAIIGAIYVLNGSMVNITSVTVRDNTGGGVLSDDSVVIIVSSQFINNTDVFGSELDVRLQNSSSQLTSWQNVVLSSEDAFLCDDCTGKLCSAGHSCSDCEHGCMMFGKKPICIESTFGCVHGTCEEIKEKNPSCKCENNYTGDLCNEHMPLSSQWENVIFIVLFGVGCVVTLALVVAFILRLHRHRAAYQPLLSYAKIVEQSRPSYHTSD